MTKTLIINIQKYSAVAVMGIALCFGMFLAVQSAPAQAQTTSTAELQAMIDSLMKQIVLLQAQLADNNPDTGDTNSVVLTDSGEGEDTVEEVGVSIGNTIVTTDRVRVRNKLTIFFSGNAIQEKGVSGTVIAGPGHMRGYTYWKVAYEDGRTGWTAEPWLEEGEEDNVVTVCPLYQQPICGSDEELVSRGTASNGCSLRSMCVENEDDVSYDLEITSPDHGDQLVIGEGFELDWTHDNLGDNMMNVTLEGNGVQRHLSAGTSIDKENIYVTIPESDGLGAVTPGTYTITISVTGIKNGSAQDERDQVKVELVEKGDETDIDLSCTIKTDKSSYEYGDDIKVSWSSTNANYVAFVPDTSGKDGLYVTNEKGNPRGYQYIEATATGNPSLTMEAHAADGSTSECRIVIPVYDAGADSSEESSSDITPVEETVTEDVSGLSAGDAVISTVNHMTKNRLNVLFSGKRSQSTGIAGTVISGPGHFGGSVWWEIEYENGISAWSPVSAFEVVEGDVLGASISVDVHAQLGSAITALNSLLQGLLK